MSEIVNNTFWAVFFGSTLGTLTVYLTVSLVDEYRQKQHDNNLKALMDEWDEFEFEEA
jgi:hypothetical protein